MIRITLKRRPIVLDEAANFDLADGQLKLSSTYGWFELKLFLKNKKSGYILFAPVRNHPSVWRVISVKAKHGFGPALYEFVMELAQLKGAIGLTPDVIEVSPQAQKVWQHYLKREDIEVLQLPDTIMHHRERPDEIKKVFRKKNPDYIQKLVAAGKVDDPQGIIRQ